jgi:ABC-type molybdenum transport system ATPase subunit/photorepair protein PhrA
MTTLESPPKLSTAIKYDGKSGASIEINKVFISIGNNDILTDINWTIYPRERWALVGRNG